MEIRLKPVSPLVGLVQAISFELINLPFAGLLSPKEHIRDDRSVNPFPKRRTTVPPFLPPAVGRISFTLEINTQKLI